MPRNVPITEAEFPNFGMQSGVQTFSFEELFAAIVVQLQSGGIVASPNLGKAAVASGANQTIVNALDTPVVWDTIEYDDLGFLDVSSGSPRDERFIVPDVDPPINKVIFGGAFRWEVDANGDIRQISDRFNFNNQGSLYPEGAFQMVQNPADPSFGPRNSISSGPTRVTAGDIFTLGAFHDAGVGNTVDVISPTAWIYVIE